ncbi:uncharacterized protein LOC125067449 [Vanessa atalanta]|uniref:uncharacterized protein LOC125067449 n=1 Tax=Vanessa atalanta TaxID=42275 RepID=UPI001FCCE1CC|nr:uncharacterized protein LOC125067449 [Vanessa atalanta]
MVARLAFVALCVCATFARAAQPAARILIDTSGYYRTTVRPQRSDIARWSTSELVEDLRNTKSDALLLYTEYTSYAAADLNEFLKNISSLTQDTIKNMENRVLDRASRACRDEFEKHIRKVIFDSHRAASFNGENHHKFFLGHMIVFRMHLNKSEDYIRRCERITRGCEVQCETSPRIIRWKRIAISELNRVKEDVLHSRRFYKDLLLHSRRKLKCLRRLAQLRAKSAVQALEQCVCHTSC